MAAMPSLVIKFTTPYKGGTHTWSTRFHFSGGLPPDAAHWHAFAEAIWADLRAGLRGDIRMSEFVGYSADSVPSVWNELQDSAGLIDETAYEYVTPAYITPLLSWTTDQRNTRGGPIFLRNFIHGGIGSSLSDLEAVHADQVGPLTHFASVFSDAGAGYSDGATTYHRAGPNGAVGLTGLCRPFFSHRVLARRG